MTAAALHPRKQILFLVLSAGDLLLTWVLLQGGQGACYESNPVAGRVLAAGGWPGLIAFKAAVVLLVAGLAVAVSRRRPRAGGRVLGFGCLAVGAVLVYSGSLLASLGSSPEARAAGELRAIEQRQEGLAREGARVRDRRRLLDRLCADLVAGQRTLAEAADAAARAAATDDAWLRPLRQRFPEYSTTECVAARLLEDSAARAAVRSPGALAPTARRLRAEFRASYGKEAPALDLRAGGSGSA